MLIFNLTIHHLWGRVLAKFQEARVVAYADDGYIKAKLRVTLQVLTELNTVFKADTGLELNVTSHVSKTSILPIGVTVQSVFDMVQTIMHATPTLDHLPDLSSAAT
jgi:hypothetical protein